MDSQKSTLEKEKVWITFTRSPSSLASSISEDNQ